MVWAGKAGTLALMFSLPMFLWADAIDPSVARRSSGSRAGASRSAVSLLGYYAAAEYVPAARRVRARAGGAGHERVGPAIERGGSRMKAVILAGGEGTRLRPLTSNQPKPMMPIANVPMMEHIVRLLARHGFDDIVVTVAFLANHIRNYFGDGSEFGVRMRYATEESPLGTAGSVRNAMDELDETFLVISGDVLTDVDLGAFVEAHRKEEAFASIALKRVENPVDFGIVITREDGTIERFLEKPTWGEVFSDTINTGIYVLEPEVFDYIPADEVVDFSSDVFPSVLDAGQKLLRARRRRLLGRRRHARGVPHRARGHPRRPGRHRRSRDSSFVTACGSERTPTSRPTSSSTARCSSATTAGSRRARCCARTPCSATTSS